MNFANGENKYINELHKQIKEKDAKIDELKRLLNENNIEYTDVIKKLDNAKILETKYFYSFLQYYIKDKPDGVYFTKNGGFFKEYIDYFNLQHYENVHLLSFAKFGCMLTSLKEYIKPGRQTLPRNHPNYKKKSDNRIKGKKIYVNNMLRACLCDLLN